MAIEDQKSQKDIFFEKFHKKIQSLDDMLPVLINPPIASGGTSKIELDRGYIYYVLDRIHTVIEVLENGKVGYLNDMLGRFFVNMDDFISITKKLRVFDFSDEKNKEAAIIYGGALAYIEKINEFLDHFSTNEITKKSAAKYFDSKKYYEIDSKLNNMEARIEGLKKGVSDHRKDLDDAISRVEKNREDKFRDALDKIINENISSVTAAKDRSEALQAEIEQIKTDATNMVALLGSATLANGYFVTKIEETKEANLWRWITVGIFALASIVAIGSLITFTLDPTQAGALWTLGLRLLTALIITMPAFYAAKESARHRSNADKANRVSLELAVLSPYLSQLNEEKRHDVRERLVDKYFGQDDMPHQVSEPLSLEQLKNKINTMSEMLTTVTDSIKSLKGDNPKQADKAADGSKAEDA